MENGEIIILSDDEDYENQECDNEISCNEPSVLIVEEEMKKNDCLTDCVLPPTALEEDLVVTFSRRAEVLPHARFDCPIYPFTATVSEVGAPVAENSLICDQCFCYVCDKLASSCVMWCYSGVCHCNSHKKSDFWHNRRNSALLGGLKHFNLTLSEIDAQLRDADAMLQSFSQELAVRFSSFLAGIDVQKIGLSLFNMEGGVHDYTEVYAFISSFLNKADKLGGRAAAIMYLGAARDCIRHYQGSGDFIVQSPTANVAKAKVMLLQRIISSLQRQMVMADFTPEFIHKLQVFYLSLYFPAELKSMKYSLCVRPWDDVLLVSVLKGQNVTGVRKDKGKKDVLMEKISIVLLRTELLQKQQRYRELCRYLRVVQTDDSQLFQQLQDLIPFFTCLGGNLLSGLGSLFPSVNAPASRFTPSLFLCYFHIFKTATAPKITVSQPHQLSHSGASWEPIKGAEPLKRAELVRFALRAQRCCSAVSTDSQCWTSLLSAVNTPLPPPSPQFLQEAEDVIKSILLDMDGSKTYIPRFFLEVYPDQALLLLVIGALAMRILDGVLSPAAPVLDTFKDNDWAFKYLMQSLPAERLCSFMQQATQEMEKTDGKSIPLLRSVESTLSSSAEGWDQLSSGC
ncbi:uncharacterized protein LOC141811058 [Halichoeres trimaculatus]|uniref:uncharacterized protein LOC141811058 n=1 Tax=Halichoeres trimaculatus TaxID=147232 RepID=UPI003D9F3D2D